MTRWRVVDVSNPTVFGMFAGPYPTVRYFRWGWVASLYCELMIALGRNYRCVKEQVK